MTRTKYAPGHTARSMMHIVCQGWSGKNLSGLHRALTSNPLNTSGINCNAGSASGLLALHQRQHDLTLVLLWLSEQLLTATFQSLVMGLP